MGKPFFEQLEEKLQDAVKATGEDPAGLYQRFAYKDGFDTTASSTPLTKLELPGNRLVRDDHEQVFVLDALIYIQGIEISAHLSGGLSLEKNHIDGHNVCRFTLSNDNDRFVWSERNLAALYGRADSSQLFTAEETLKASMYVYKADQVRNPRILSPRNAPEFARFDLAPNRAIFNRMDPIRVFVAYPYRPATLRTSGSGQNIGELWMPEFTGYVEMVSIEDDDINGHSTVTIEACDIMKAVLHRMRISFDPVSGIAEPLSRVGFAVPTVANLEGTGQGTSSVDSPQAVAAAQSSIVTSNGFFNPNDTLFYDQIAGSIFNNQAYPNQPMEGVVKELVVFKKSTRADGYGHGGVRGVEYGGTFTYDSLSEDQKASRAFLSEWHSFCLFGPKRRPWLREEVEYVAERTTTDGEHAPNKLRLWFLLPIEGSGPRSVADLSSINANMSHNINWSNRFEVLKDIVSTLDYRMQVTPCGDFVCEFPFADFRPEDFGDYKDVFRVSHGLKSSSFGDEQDAPVAALIVTTNLGPYAAEPNNDPTGTAKQFLQTATVYSPYIAARYGMSVDGPIQLPFLSASQLDIAQQRAVIEFQKRLAQCNACEMNFTYRPFLLPNRPLQHVRRTRMGLTVSVSSDITISGPGEANTSTGLEYVRQWTGYYRGESDHSQFEAVQKEELDQGGLTTQPLITGIDTIAPTAVDPMELQVYTTVLAGESVPMSARVGWSNAPLTPACGAYILDAKKLSDAALKASKASRGAIAEATHRDASQGGGAADDSNEEVRGNGVDYSTSPPGAAALLAEGVTFVVRYVPIGSLPKSLTRAELDDLRANNLPVALVYEQFEADPRGGFSVGVRHGRLAVAGLTKLGLQKSTCVYFAIDYQAPDGAMNEVDGYLAGAASVMGIENIGVYGGLNVIEHCSQARTASFFWQTFGWSRGSTISDAAHLYQRGQVTIRGTRCDINKALKPNFGQIG